MPSGAGAAGRAAGRAAGPNGDSSADGTSLPSRLEPLGVLSAASGVGDRACGGGGDGAWPARVAGAGAATGGLGPRGPFSGVARRGGDVACHGAVRRGLARPRAGGRASKPRPEAPPPPPPVARGKGRDPWAESSGVTAGLSGLRVRVPSSDRSRSLGSFLSGKKREKKRGELKVQKYWPNPVIIVYRTEHPLNHRFRLDL